MRLPIGFRFHPTPEELLQFYLQRKVNGEAMPADVVKDLNPFQREPWKLFDETQDEYFYVFTKMKIKALQWEVKTAGSGIWVFKDCTEITDQVGRIIGSCREFQFLFPTLGEAPHHGDWVMQQFSLVVDNYGVEEEAEVDVVCKLRNMDMDLEEEDDM